MPSQPSNVTKGKQHSAGAADLPVTPPRRPAEPQGEGGAEATSVHGDRDSHDQERVSGGMKTPPTATDA